MRKEKSNASGVTATFLNLVPKSWLTSPIRRPRRAESGDCSVLYFFEHLLPMFAVGRALAPLSAMVLFISQFCYCQEKYVRLRTQ
jgi:hypothetical protein